MTLLAETETEPEAASDEGGGSLTPRRRFLRIGLPRHSSLEVLRRLPVRRIAATGLMGVVVLVGIWLICADPIAHVWYENRQHSLAGQVASAETRLGSQVPKIGQEVGVLQDPTIGLNVVMAQGDSAAELRGGPGHRLGTPLPGARGNSVVYGHARDWGAPFRNLAKLTVGSVLYIQAHPGVYKLPETGDFIYTVVAVQTTTAEDIGMLAPSNDYRLTLITNAGGRLAGDKVLVVTAVSGKAGKTAGKVTASSLEPSQGPVLNLNLLRALLGGAVAAFVIVLLRRNHRPLIVATVAAPVVMVAVWSLFLEFDMWAFRPLA
jgi:sortase A